MKKVKYKNIIAIVVVLFIVMVFLIYSSILSEENTNVPKVKQQSNISKSTKLDNSIQGSIFTTLSSNLALINLESLKKDFKYNNKIDNTNIKKDQSIFGYFDSAIIGDNELFTAAGWVYSANNNIEYILFVNDKGEIRGCGLIGAKRVGLSEAIGKKNADNFGFVGYIKINHAEEIYALVKIKNKDEYIKLGQHYNLKF